MLLCMNECPQNGTITSWPLVSPPNGGSSRKSEKNEPLIFLCVVFETSSLWSSLTGSRLTFKTHFKHLSAKIWLSNKNKQFFVLLSQNHCIKYNLACNRLFWLLVSDTLLILFEGLNLVWIVLYEGENISENSCVSLNHVCLLFSNRIFFIHRSLSIMSNKELWSLKHLWVNLILISLTLDCP